ncbi:hypothetical protein IQ07DRAFT_605216 [Pyrenochaeta sp. DS3sAY3a]|nr:hypothetical protein IQ07DRAFT_605216 [Pyrenochaeta sp. DS3sAY3a]
MHRVQELKRTGGRISRLLEYQERLRPLPQPYYTFSAGSWVAVEPAAFPEPAYLEPTIKDVYVLTWCVDGEEDLAAVQMAAVLAELERTVAFLPDSAAVVIHLQELEQTAQEWVEGTSRDDQNLSDVLQAEWVRKRFNVTDVDTERWDMHFLLRGSVTLIDRRLAVESVSRLPLVKGSNATEVILVSVQVDIEDGLGSEVMTFANVVLEQQLELQHEAHWTILQNQLRGEDMDGRSTHMGSAAAIVAGVCGMTEDRGYEFPYQNLFKDVYIKLGKERGAKEGITWPREGCRMDKQAYFGDLKATELKRMGVNLLRDGSDWEPLLPQYGLSVHYELEGGIYVAKEE